jgi:hypothetical protein
MAEPREELGCRRREYRVDEAAERDGEDALAGVREDRAHVNAGAAHRTEAVVDSSRHAHRTDAVDFEAVVVARLARDRHDLFLGELRRSDEHVPQSPLAEIAVTHVDEQRLALHRDFDPTAGAPSGSRCDTQPPSRPAAARPLPPIDSHSVIRPLV